MFGIGIICDEVTSSSLLPHSFVFLLLRMVFTVDESDLEVRSIRFFASLATYRIDFLCFDFFSFSFSFSVAWKLRAAG